MGRLRKFYRKLERMKKEMAPPPEAPEEEPAPTPPEEIYDEKGRRLFPAEMRSGWYILNFEEASFARTDGPRVNWRTREFRREYGHIAFEEMDRFIRDRMDRIRRAAESEEKSLPEAPRWVWRVNEPPSRAHERFALKRKPE